MLVRRVDHTSKLAEIAGPVVSLKGRHGLGGEAAACRAGAPIGALKERLGQKQEVIPAVPQRKSRDYECSQSIVKLRSKLLVPERGFGIAGRGGNQSHPPVQRCSQPRLEVTRQGQDVSNQES